MNHKHTTRDEFDKGLDNLLKEVGKTKEDLPEGIKFMLDPNIIDKAILLDEFNELSSYNALLCSIGLFLDFNKFLTIDTEPIIQALKTEVSKTKERMVEVQELLLGIKFPHLKTAAKPDDKSEV